MPPDAVVERLQEEEQDQVADKFTGNDSLVEGVVLVGVLVVIEGEHHSKFKQATIIITILDQR